jgi:ArsR family transcriptional regulator, arsenate/arsenite/antimonite-responsive transcriptional repressor
MDVYVFTALSLPQRIGVCQYRQMSKSVIVLDPLGTAACCPPLTAQPLSQAQADQIAPLLKALADPVRLRLISLVASHAGGEACVCDLNDAFDLSQPTISHHLKVLHDAGLLDREKRGVWAYYRIRTEALASVGALIASGPAAG